MIEFRRKKLISALPSLEKRIETFVKGRGKKVLIYKYGVYLPVTVDYAILFDEQCVIFYDDIEFAKDTELPELIREVDKLSGVSER